MTTDRNVLIRDLTDELADLDFDIQRLTEWQTRLEKWRKTLCDELLALPPRIRSPKDLGVQQNLTLSITMVDRGLPRGTGYELETLRLGQLMQSDGCVQVGADPARNYGGTLPWAGSLDDMSRFLTDLHKRKAAAEARLHEASLDDDTRARLAAERDIAIAEANARPTRKTRGDGSQYDKYPDGRSIEVNDMSQLS